MTAAYNLAVDRVGLPARFRCLPVDDRGFPVPRFVEWIDGKPDFRAIDGRWMLKAVRQRLCWLCGERLGRHMAFVIGPMCAVNRVNSEPPSHLECARFAAKACPFLSQPKRRRNEHDLPAMSKPAAGIPLDRNPGVALVWVTGSYKSFDAGNGVMFSLGDPSRLEWYAHGREATRKEVLASIDSGLPILREIAAKEGHAARVALERQIDRGLGLVPR